MPRIQINFERTLKKFIVILRISLLFSENLHAGYSSDDIVVIEPNVVYSSMPGGYYSKWNDACTASSPGCYPNACNYPTEACRICYSGGIGHFDYDGTPSCRYTVTWYQKNGGSFQDTNWEGRGWATPYLACPKGWNFDYTNKICYRYREKYLSKTCQYGNPINPGLGSKLYSDRHAFPHLPHSDRTEVQYSSFNIDQLKGTLGDGWFIFPYDRRLIINSRYSNIIQAVRSAEQREFFKKPWSQWMAVRASNIEISERIDSFHLFDKNTNSYEIYNKLGWLLDIYRPSGAHTRVVRNEENHITSIEDDFGRKITITPMENELRANAPDNQIFQYTKDGISSKLKEIKFPDLNKKFFLHEESLGPGVPPPQFPDSFSVIGVRLSAPEDVTRYSQTPSRLAASYYGEYDSTPLTGTIDESSVRYSTYKYDTSGRAIRTELADSANGISIGYDSNSFSVAPDNRGVFAKGSVTLNRVVYETGTSQPGGAGCSASSSAITYDNNGNVTSRTDFTGPPCVRLVVASIES